MRAVVLDHYGPPEVLHVRDVPRPQLQNHEVLIAVHAAGVNPIDWRIRRGSLRWLLPAQMPLTIGFDVAGVIAEVGPQADPWQVGDEVFCFLDGRLGGGYAEYARATANVVAGKPMQASFAEAAAAPLAACTALRALRDLGKITSGCLVLINGGSGGVGTLAIQLAKCFGAQVTAVCSTSNLALVRQLGADHAIDYTRDDFRQQDCRYDIVFDAVAKSSYWACRRILTSRGRYITTVPTPGTCLTQALARVAPGPRCLNILVRPRGSDLRQIQELMDEGKLRTVIEEVLPLQQAAEAHRRSEAGHVRGKLVLQVQEAV